MMVPREPARDDLSDPIMLLALGFGTGLVPRAPGTAGSVVGLGLHLVVAALPPLAQLLAILAVVCAGIPVCGIAAKRLGEHDHSAIVWDELACVPIALALVPLQPAWLAIGWVAFRVFDVTKPWPIGWLERRLGGGLGIMADDFAAASIAAAVAWAVHAGWLAL
jgi:phosphatidylglycerophosphatase A